MLTYDPGEERVMSLNPCHIHIESPVIERERERERVEEEESHVVCDTSHTTLART